MTKQFETLEEELDYCWDAMISDPQDAFERIERILRSLSRGHKEFRRVQFYYGACFLYLGRQTEAIDYLTEILQEAIEDDDHFQIRRIENARGMTFITQGRYADAAQALENALEHALSTKSKDSEIAIRLNLAALFFDLDDIDSVEHQLSHIRKIPAEHSNDEWNSEIQLLQARIALKRFDFNAAAVHIRDARTLGHKIEYQHLLVNAEILEARLTRLQGDLDQAIEKLEWTLNQPQFEFEGALGSTAYIELIKSLMAQSRMDEAKQHMDEALKLLEKQDNPSFRYQLSELLARASIEREDFEAATQHLNDALRLKETVDTHRVSQTLAIKQYQMKETELKNQRRLAQQENDLLKASQAQLATVNTFARELAKSLDMERLGRTLYDLMRSYFDAHFVSVAIHHPHKNSIEFISIIENGIHQNLFCVMPGHPESRNLQCTEEQHPIVIREQEPVNLFGVEGPKPRSQLFLPLMLESQVFGVLSSQSSNFDRFAGDDLDLVSSIAPFITLALDNALSHERVFALNRSLQSEKDSIERAESKIRHLANHDPLTDMHNRRALDEHLDGLIETCRKGKTSFAFVMIDLDGFKPINDQHGHPIGDEVLRVISQRLRRVLRGSDFSARVGGDEFVLVLPSQHVTSDAHIEAMVKRVLASIEEPIVVSGIEIHVSASIGVVQYNEKIQSLNELMHFADQAMYFVKHHGKAGIRFHPFSPGSESNNSGT